MDFETGYRSVIYDGPNKQVLLNTWDDEGHRITKEIPYKPYYYVESYNSRVCDAISLYGGSLKKREFESSYDRFKSTQDDILKTYYNLPCEQQFLIDYYHNKPCYQDLIKFSENPLKIWYLDIEVHADEFPDAEEVAFPINVITLYDTVLQKYFTWGVKEFECPESEKHERVYVACDNEVDLLKKFIKFWRSDFPDIVTGWNFIFDSNYIINRIRKLFGYDAKVENKLSPVGRIRQKTRLNKFQQVETYWVITGVSMIDYMELYKKFTPNEKESYKLDHIAEIELGENKIEYDGSLYELANKDWNTFVEYNIHDTRLLRLLENYLHYLEILRMIAYMGLCNFEDTMGTVQPVNGALAVKARQQGRIISTFKQENSQNYTGGFVFEPTPGMYENVVSFDLNSLYPNIIITLNASPETKIGKIISETDEKICVKLYGDTVHEIDRDIFKKWIKQQNLSLSKSGVLFTQDEQGLIPRLVDEQYKKRVNVKGEIKQLKKQLHELNKDSDEYREVQTKIKQRHILQYQIKIFINSVYGYLGNKYAALCDYDIASSVTQTGQETIKTAWNAAINHKIHGQSIQGVYGDTDSFIGDTIIETEFGRIKVEDLYRVYKSPGNTFKTAFGHDLIRVVGLKVLSADLNTLVPDYAPVKHIIRHKTKKKKYRIVVEDKEIFMTEDEGMMVKRNGEFIRISPKEYQKNDLLLVKNNNNANTTSDVEIVCVGEFESDEYVYDLEMENSKEPWFFANDVLVHNSVYLSFSNIFKKNKHIPFCKENSIIPSKETFDICDEVEVLLNNSLKEWAKNELNSIDCRLEFKREAICTTGLFVAKKRYILRVINMEGDNCDNIKYTGIEIVSTNIPSEVKPYLKNVVRTLMETQQKQLVDKEYDKAYKLYESSDISKIAYPKGIKNYNKYADECKGFTKLASKMPIHCKSAYFYNLLLDHYGISKKHPKIKSGDKIRYLYVTQNKFGIKTIAYKDKYPEEFKEDFNPDVKLMFSKMVSRLMERIYHPMGWKIPEVVYKPKVDLFDIFS